MTTGKNIALTIWTFVSKVMSQIFNILSRLVIAFLPRSKCLLISCLQSPSSVILEPSKIKSVTVSIISPSIWHEMMGLDAMILVFLMLSFKPTFSLFSLSTVLFYWVIIQSNWFAALVQKSTEWTMVEKNYKIPTTTLLYSTLVKMVAPLYILVKCWLEMVWASLISFSWTQGEIFQYFTIKYVCYRFFWRKSSLD